MISLIQANGLKKSFHGRQAVKGIDMEIRKGEVLALIGENGAGKSTLIAMLLGILKPDAGSVGYWRTDYKPHIGAQLQTTPFFEGFSARENLSLFSALYEIKSDKKRLSAKLEEFGLSECGNTPASRLSVGQQKRLAIAVTTMHEPELVILDEPTAGLDPRARHDIIAMIEGFRQRGVTVMFSSHDMEEVRKLADRVILLHRGELAAQGTIVELLGDQQYDSLETFYLKQTEDNRS